MAQPTIPAASVVDNDSRAMDEERSTPSVWVVDMKSHRVVRQQPAVGMQPKS
jgi:hypothetical protein